MVKKRMLPNICNNKKKGNKKKANYTILLLKKEPL